MLKTERRPRLDEKMLPVVSPICSSHTCQMPYPPEVLLMAERRHEPLGVA